MERKKLAIEEMQQIAKARGGKCLSKEYIDSHTKLKWRCREGHEWKAIPASTKRGSWCPYCSGSLKLTIREMQEIAAKRGGECLSKKYINALSKLKWQCKEGHRWEAPPHRIKTQGSWCPYCAKKAKLTMEELQRIAEEKGGACLSKEFIDYKTKLRWRCEEGHVWEAVPYSIKIGQWCPYCAGKAKLTIEEMQKLAASRNGQCLSKKYINSYTKLKWKCKKGHKWEARPVSIKAGRWCPYCAGKAKLTIEEMRKIAKEREGKCLSKKYINNRTKLRWQCKKGHKWEAVPYSIKNHNTWCPVCAVRK
jgi:uncharacterized Zn-finger protein